MRADERRRAETRSSSPRSSSLRKSLSSHGARPRPVSAASTAASWGLSRRKGNAGGRSWSGQRVRRKEVGSVSVVRWRPRAHAPAHGSVRALEDVLRDIFETEREFDLGRRGDCHGRLEGARDTARRAGEPRRPQHRRLWFNSRDSTSFWAHRLHSQSRVKNCFPIPRFRFIARPSPGIALFSCVPTRVNRLR